MARKSRKGVSAQPAVPAGRVWNAAVYARLSLEDSGRKGADTIETQIDLVSSHVARHPQLSLYDTYVDNGVSGKDFERPAWNRLMDDIRAGAVDCICVKDLSRFSRNYIETCEFLEKIFPFMGVRFLSVNDGYDSNAPGDQNEGLIIALKSLINDQYLKDISKKICASVKARRERGEYTNGAPAYGYQRMEEAKNKLEPDPVAAPIVREIFELRAAGKSRTAISKILEERKILPPTAYKIQKYGTFNKREFISSIWYDEVIGRIIRSPIYKGTLVTGMDSQRLYEHKKRAPVPRDQWVVTENAHEPIVSSELWEAANAVEFQKGASQREIKSHAANPPVNIFRGFVTCGFCGGGIYRRSQKRVRPYPKTTLENVYFQCKLHRQHPEKPYRAIREDTLYNAVYPLVAEKLKEAANLGAIIEKIMKRQDNPRAAFNSEIARLSRELETLNQRIAGLYESYVGKLLTEMEYVGIKAEYERRAESLRLNIYGLSRRVEAVADASDNHWLTAARMFQNPDKLTREMLEAIVERIVVFSPERVEVVWRFRDEFEFLKECAASEEGVA